VSYNQPKFGALALWSANAITFADSSTVGHLPYGIFVNTNNTIYVAETSSSSVQVWLGGNINRTETIFGNWLYPVSLFVTYTGDIYVDNGFLIGQVDKSTLNATTSVAVMYVSHVCYGLFVDINDTLYCSIGELHQVITKSLNNNSDTLTIVAGTGCYGLTMTMLNSPRGIFVNINLALYVADCGNDRVQLFSIGQLNGNTVAGVGAPNTISLNCPTGVVLDADQYLFIVDNGNHRIVGSGPTGFRCVVGCFGGGSAPNQLNNPQSMSFDSHGNIFVADTSNGRIQQFILISNSCSKIFLQVFKYYALIVVRKLQKILTFEEFQKLSVFTHTLVPSNTVHCSKKNKQALRKVIKSIVGSLIRIVFVVDGTMASQQTVTSIMPTGNVNFCALSLCHLFIILFFSGQFDRYHSIDLVYEFTNEYRCISSSKKYVIQLFPIVTNLLGK
jgi:hypothetical protein